MKRKPMPVWCVKSSIWLNEQTGGHKGWTLCAQWWDHRLRTEPTKYRVICTLVDAVFAVVFNDPQHCRASWLQRNRTGE